MAEVHTTLRGANNEVTIVFHNIGQPPISPSAGKVIVPTGTSATGVAIHGTADGVGPVIDNPA